MLKRNGFTLIELLIVVVIIGILAAIAIPKFSATREKSIFAAMKADLRNLQAQQEVYYSINRGTPPEPRYSYAADVDDVDLGFVMSSGVKVTIGGDAGSAGWSALATHRAFNNAEAKSCAVFVGNAAPLGPATVADVVTCQGET
jgi:prepilin-type N-terminal cleavage/methylation domain-containing protein